MKALRVDFDQPGAAVHQASSPVAGPDPVLGLQALAGQVALWVEHALGVTAGTGREDDHGRVLRVEIGDVGGGLLGAVLVERIGDLGHRHRRDSAGQLAEQLLLADAELRVRRLDPDLEVLPAQLGVAGHCDGAHPKAGEHREHPFDPAADQRHHGIAALDAERRHGARETGAAGDQLAVVPLAPSAERVDGDDPERRRGRPLHDVLDEVHPGKSAGGAG